jgi:hypothetical protein
MTLMLITDDLSKDTKKGYRTLLRHMHDLGDSGTPNIRVTGHNATG